MVAIDTEVPVKTMSQAELQLEQLQKQLETLHQNLRTVRHGINNNIAVIMAMAELSQRNPAQCAKLCQLCLEKAPQIASAISSFSELVEGAMNLQKGFDEQSVPTTV